MAQGMGFGDAARRINMLNTNDPRNKKFVRSAVMGNKYYDFYSTYHKKPGSVDQGDKAYLELLGLGREYSKFSSGLGSVFQYDDDMY